MRKKLPKIRDCPRRGLSLKILVTGGAGFIGSEFVRILVKQGLSTKGTVPEILVVDNLTYAGDLKRLEEVKEQFEFYKADICDKSRIEFIFNKEKPDYLVNFAAQTHVDRSIVDAVPFVDTNIKGVLVLLDMARKYKIRKFLQISTDEVYGETKLGKFSEESSLRPNSPYAASKAAADLLIKSYIRTYNFPAIIVRPCNNYGPWQYPEKLIPVIISRALKNRNVPVYAKGQNIREWLYVSDCAKAILSVLKKGRTGEIYNIGSGQEKRNIEVVKKILKILGKPNKLIRFVKDRPGHDIRYRLNSKKVVSETGWKPKVGFEQGIRLTVNWYLSHKNWP